MNTTQHYDVVILGTGPAGFQAAIHASRKKVSVLVLSKEAKSSMYHAHQAINIPGIYAAGDVCGPPWQEAKAVGEGCAAGINAAVFAKKGRP